MVKNKRLDNGYVLIEIVVSIFLSLFVIFSAISIFSAIAIQYNRSIAYKELVESADYVEQVFVNEFSKSKAVEEVLNSENKVIKDIDISETINFKCIGLLKSRYILYQSGYVEEFLYGGESLNYERKPIFISRQYSTNKSSKDYRSFSGFEVGNHIKQMSIKKIDDYCYIIGITLSYRDTDIIYKKEFLTRLKGF